MVNIILPYVLCPLCDAKMKKSKMMYGQMKTTAYVCTPCEIFTFSFDPAFNRWKDTNKKIPCPMCQSEVRWFSRHTDNYMKFVCPKCGVKGEGDCNSVIQEDGTVDLELMDRSSQAPQENHVQVPIDNLRIPQDMKNKLKHKMQKNREKGK